jgi:hypothetical protein
MSIENNLKRIADALEALVNAQGIVAEPATKAEPAKKPAAKKPAAEKKAPGKKPAAEKKEKPAALSIKDDIRPLMKQLRTEVGPAAVKTILKKYDATTLQQLDAKDYSKVIIDIQAELE